MLMDWWKLQIGRKKESGSNAIAQECFRQPLRKTCIVCALCVCVDRLTHAPCSGAAYIESKHQIVTREWEWQWHCKTTEKRLRTDTLNNVWKKRTHSISILHASRQRVFHTRTLPHDQHNRLIVFYVNMLYLFVCAQHGCKMAHSISIVKRVHGENKILAFKLGSESWRNVIPWTCLVAGSCARWNQFTSKMVFAIWMSSNGFECVRVCVCALCTAHEWSCRKIVNCLDDFERSNFRMRSQRLRFTLHIHS